MASSEWEYDMLEEGAHKLVGEAQLRTYGRFLEEFSTQLRGIEEALEDGINDSCNISYDLIYLQFESHEHTNLLQLIDTDNKVLKKVLIVLTTLCAEVRYLKNEAKTKFLDMLLFYGENGVESGQDTAVLVSMSLMLPQLQDLACFVKRCMQVTNQIVEQLSFIYVSNRDVSQVINATDIHFKDVFQHLGEVLFLLVTLDEVINNQSALHNHWLLYKRTLKSVHHDPAKFNVSKERLKYFEKLLSDLENQLLTGKIFQKAVQQIVDVKRGILSKNAILAEEFNSYLKSALMELEAKSLDLLDSEELSTWMNLCAFYVLNFNLFGTTDKKMFKRLWDLSKKVPAVTLVGNVIWFPEEFFIVHFSQVSKMLDKKIEPMMENYRKHYLQQKVSSLPKEANVLGLQTSLWMIQMEVSLKQESTHLKLEDLKQRCNLFLQGVQFACNIGRLLKIMTNLHVILSKPMTKTAGLALCKLVELIKGIQQLYHRHYMAIADSINHVIQHLSFQILSVISTVKNGLVQDRRYSEKHLDILSSLVLANKVLHGPGTKDRRLVTRLALSVANQMRTFRDDELVHLNNLLHNLDIVCDIQEKLQTACDCEFLYWHRVLIPIYFGSLYESKTDLSCLVYMFDTLEDCLKPINRIKHASPQVMKDCLDDEVCQYLNEQIIRPLCHDIETNLRLHVHSHLQLEDRNPFTVGVHDYSPLFRTKPLKFLNRYVNIKGYIEHYLDQTFYNLTTVALHDWRTYGEMRSLAKHKYGLNTVEDHLPSQTLEQGLDVLEIMRNIHIFVSKYLYNLNNQIFIEQSSNNKHLNTINIRHIANSIRTHGTGIMNTTVNFTYQFLRKKFFIFSQFMYDEHIKSRLIKDLRYFRDNKSRLQQKYSYERADKLNRGIRKLGLTPEGESFLDQFRTLISHIGNAMGYVRMIRSGGLHWCSNAICFVPDLEDTVNFEELCRSDLLSDVCVDAAKRLDHVIANLAQNFSEGTEYFKLLVDVFSPVFRDPKNMHLRNFYVIIPALTINFVEHSITSKEKMSKKNKVGAAFTDDGFAMGIAYILKLLDQYAEFDSLHWFQSMQDKYNGEKLELNKQNKLATKDDEKLQQTMTLTARRLNIYQQEFDLLYYSLSSARIFFKKDTSESEELNTKSESSPNTSYSILNI